MPFPKYKQCLKDIIHKYQKGVGRPRTENQIVNTRNYLADILSLKKKNSELDRARSRSYRESRFDLIILYNEVNRKLPILDLINPNKHTRKLIESSWLDKNNFGSPTF